MSAWISFFPSSLDSTTFFFLSPHALLFLLLCLFVVCVWELPLSSFLFLQTPAHSPVLVYCKKKPTLHHNTREATPCCSPQQPPSCRNVDEPSSSELVCLGSSETQARLLSLFRLCAFKHARSRYRS